MPGRLSSCCRCCGRRLLRAKRSDLRPKHREPVVMLGRDDDVIHSSRPRRASRRTPPASARPARRRRPPQRHDPPRPAPLPHPRGPHRLEISLQRRLPSPQPLDDHLAIGDVHLRDGTLRGGEPVNLPARHGERLAEAEHCPRNRDRLRARVQEIAFRFVVRRKGDRVSLGRALPKRCANFGNERLNLDCPSRQAGRAR